MSHQPAAPADPDRIPPDERRIPVRPPPVEGSLAPRLAGVRTGFLRYAVAGGSLMGAFVAALTTGAGGWSEVGTVMVGGTFVGFSVGIISGWTSFRMLERATVEATPRAPVALAIALGLAVPPYLAAGLVAGIAGSMFRSMPTADIERLIPGVLAVLAVAGIVLLPIAAIFGRRDPDRPVTLSAALAEGSGVWANPRGASRTFWGFAVGVTLLVVGFLVALVGLAVVQGLDPGGWERLTREFGASVGIAFIGLWILASVVGWKLTMRLVDWLRRPG